MKIKNIFEAGAVSAAFAFGRFNPAHQGHIEVWRTVEEAGANWFIGTNPTTVGPNDPLSFEQKKAWMEEIYPPITGHLVPETSVMTLAARIFKELGNDENATVAYITDETDWAWSGKLLNQYNGKEGAHGYYKFAQIIHEPSPRVSSATALRDAARADDRVAFYHASGTDPKAKVAGKTYFDTVKEACAKYPVPVKRGQKVAEGYDEEELANEVYAEFERTYPNLARRADERTIHAAIVDVLNYGGDSNPSALAQDIARAVKRDMQQGVAEGAPIVVMPSPERLKKAEPTKVRYQGDIVPPTKPPSTEKRGVKGRPDQGVAEAEGDPEGVPHITKELLQHIVQQAGTEGAHAIIKSLEWGDGAAKELLQLIVKDLKNNISMAESVKQRLDPSCWKGKHKEGTKIKGGVEVNNCVPNESVAEASLATMRDYFAGDAKANDPLEITKQRLYFDPKAVANKRKEFKSQWDYDQWLKKHNLKSVSGNLKEDGATLSVGDPVEITGDVRFKGATGEVEHVGEGGAFLVVNLYNFGKRSFHSSDVSYNDYVDSDEEEARAYDADPDARDWQHESANPVLSTEKAKKVSPILGTKPKKHPFNGRLVGEDLEKLQARMNEVSNTLLGRYKKAAGADASKADKEGDFDKGNKRFKGIVKATNKEFDNDMKKNKGTDK